MTDEAHGYNSEDAPIRPASTRWTEDTVQDDAVRDDDGLAPPYVPGRRTPSAASTSTTSTSSSPPSTTSDDDFPFDQFDIGGEADAAAPESPVREEAAAEDERGVTDDFGAEADETVWSPEELDEGDIDDDAEPYGEWMPGYEEDDSSAVDAELEPITEEPPVEEVETEHRFEPDGSIETEPSGERAQEVAAVLDRLAGLLREEGEDAVRREMQSPDRLTALVSSLLSGHLSARE